MPKSNKFREVRVSFTDNALDRKRADMGAQILHGMSFSLLCKKMYRECKARAPRVENVPAHTNVSLMTREELFYAKFLARDRDFVEIVLIASKGMKPGDFMPSKAFADGIWGEFDHPRTEMIGLGRVMKIMGWPRRQQRRNGKLVWGYVKPERHEIP